MDFFNLDLYSLIASLFVLFTVLPVHEFAHAWMAYKLGDDTAALQGRLTLNPFAHLDLLGAATLILTQRFGWAKPVPVNPTRFDRKYSLRAGMALTAAAGPISNLIMAFLTLILSKLLELAYIKFAFNPTAALAIYSILLQMVYVNISLAVFNLVPIHPLDGGKILDFFIPAKLEAKINNFHARNPQVSRFLPMILFVLIWTTPIISRPLSFLTEWIFAGMDFLTGFIDLLARFI